MVDASPPHLFTEKKYSIMASDEEDEEDNNGWEDWEEEAAADIVCVCLLCPSSFPSVASTIDHLTSSHHFDLLLTKRQLGLDEYGTARLINLIRSKTLSMEEILGITSNQELINRLVTDDELLRPVLADDPLLYELDNIPINFNNGKEKELSDLEFTRLQLKLDDAQFQALAEITTSQPVVQQLAEQYAKDSREFQQTLSRLRELETSFRNYKELAEHAMGDTLNSDNLEEIRQDHVTSNPTAPEIALDSYFGSYSHYGIHEEMLKDDVRTISYGFFIDAHRDSFKDKVVLDVGCGTGILSMFAAKAGARKVYGVDASDIITQAQENVHENGFDDQITLFRGKMEDIILAEKVDIIVSEWMGYFLLYESMLDTVLIARDRWLKPGGRVYPVLCVMYIAGLDHQEWTKERLHFWDDVYGFKMTSMKPLLYHDAAVEYVNPGIVATSQYAFKKINAETVQITELEFASEFEVTAKRAHQLNAFVTYFDVDFDPEVTEAPTRFTTGPFGIGTHWKQTVLYLKETITLEQDDIVQGNLKVRRLNENKRALEITLTYGLKTSFSSLQFTQTYRLA